MIVTVNISISDSDAKVYDGLSTTDKLAFLAMKLAAQRTADILAYNQDNNTLARLTDAEYAAVRPLLVKIWPLLPPVTKPKITGDILKLP